jgi:hypothetical protein
MAAGAVVLATAAVAGATETQWWFSDSPADYAKAEVRGARVRADGVIESGPAVASFGDDSLRVAWALAVLADGSVAIGGDHGRIDRWTPGAGIRPWVKLGAGQVLSLARDGNTLLAGTGPTGLVYRIGAKGDTTRIARTGERYVWALAAGREGAIWAATGTLGRLLRLEGGRTRTVFDSEDSNLLCLAGDGAGGVYVGGDSKGRVYHVTAAGVASTEYDAGEDEIRALARAADGSVWAAAMTGGTATTDDGSDDDERPAPSRASTAAPGRAVVYRLAPDSAAVLWWTSPQPLVYALSATAEGPLAATGNRAGLYRLERPGTASQLLAPSQGQVTALATVSEGVTWAVTSNPVMLWRLGPAHAGGGELISPAYDAKRFARFGRVRAHGAGSWRLLTRSGNSDPPDTTWTPWKPVEADEDGGRVASPAARYLQWKVVLGSADARLDDIAIAWREQNVAPRVEEVGIAPQALGFRDGEISARSEAVTQTLTGGQKVEYSMSLPSSRAIRELPVWARGLRTLTWRASDANGDAMRYRVEIRSEQGGSWIEIGKDLEATLYTWNTNTIPDGRYRLRVTASDAPGNAIGEERTGDAVSEPFTVDNTPPTVSELSADGARIRGVATDAMSPIWRLEVAIDDGDWRTLTPSGGLADSRRAAFEAQLPGLKPGAHVASVRAVDLAGNSATRAVSLQVPATR